MSNDICCQLQQQVSMIEAELGMTPQGIYASVRTRLDILEARINNPNVPAPNTTNPFYIGYSGVSIQTSIGNPQTLMISAVPGSLYLRQDGYFNDSLYVYSADGYWSAINNGSINFSGDLQLNGNGTQTVIGIQGIPISSSYPQDGYALIYNSIGASWVPQPVGSRSVSISNSYIITDGIADIFVYLSTAPISITLPSAPFLGERHLIKDVNDLANTHNITLAAGGKNIEQFAGGVSSSLNINIAGAAVALQWGGTAWNIV